MELSPPSASHPHELRALEVTNALHFNTPLNDILLGYQWTTDLVFATHFLQDVSTEDTYNLRVL